MFYIRKNAYETNSSSSHSLSLGKGDVCDDFPAQDVLRKGVIELSIPIIDGEPIWGFDQSFYRFYRCESKLLYALVHAAGGDISGKADGGDVIPALRDEHVYVAELIDFIESVTGCSVKFELDAEADIYIDHQSVAYNVKDLRNPEFLKKLLFMSDSYVQTGSDHGIGPYMIPTDRGAELNRPEIIGDFDDTRYAVQFIKQDNLLTLRTMGFEDCSIQLDKPWLARVFGFDEDIKASLERFQATVPAYVSYLPPEVLKEFPDPGFDPNELAMDLLLKFWQMQVGWYNGYEEQNRQLLISPHLEKNIVVSGTTSENIYDIFSLQAFEMVWLCDKQTFDLIKNSFAKASREAMA